MNKLCKDCKYYNPDPFRGLILKTECSAPQNMSKIDYATGKKTHKWFSLKVLREDRWLLSVLLHTCGRSARWFKKGEYNHE